MTLEAWLWVMRISFTITFLVCLLGNIRGATTFGKVARRPNRPLSKSAMLGLNILLLGAAFAAIAVWRARVPVDGWAVFLALGRNAFWLAMALKIMIAEEIVIRRRQPILTREGQQALADEVGVTPDQVRLILQRFLA